MVARFKFWPKTTPGYISHLWPLSSRRLAPPSVSPPPLLPAFIVHNPVTKIQKPNENELVTAATGANMGDIVLSLVLTIRGYLV